MQTQKKINILFVIFQLKIGGSEKLVLDLIRSLDRNRYNPVVAWLYNDYVSQEFKNLNIPMHYVPKKARFDVGTMLGIASIIRQYRIDVVNVHHFMPMIYCYYGAKQNNARLIYTEHSEWEIRNLKPIWKWLGGYFLNRSQKTIGVSKKVTACLQKTFGIQPRLAATIHNGTDFKRFKKNPSFHREKLLAELDLREDDIVVGMTANFRKIKNHMFLLEAFKALIKTHPYAKLMLIGQGYQGDPDDTEPLVRQYIDVNNLSANIKILGYRSDIPELLNIMDIFCLTSKKEGLPISIIEAMATGLPIVGTDVEGIREVVIDNRNGFLVEQKDVNGLKNALATLIDNQTLRNHMGANSMQLAEKSYSFNQCSANYHTLFSQGAYQ